MKYASAVYPIRIAKSRRKGWTVSIGQLSKPRSARERKTRKALARLLLNLEHDMHDCSCPSLLEGIFKHKYGDPLPPFDACPACELKASLRL